jgi:hypothetical protein
MPPVAAHAQDAFAAGGRRSAQESPARRRRSEFPWLRLCLGSGAVTAALVVLARQPEPLHHGALERVVIDPALVSAPPPTWEAIASPAALYAVEAPDMRHLPFSYDARRDRSGAREDILTFGAADDASRPHSRLTVHAYRHPDGPVASFFVDLTRRAADAGLAVTRSAPASGLQTKFGQAEMADVTLSSGAERACLAVRLARPEAALAVGGWLCGAGSEPPGPRQLRCLIDGLALRSAENASVSVLFAAAERQRDPSCAPPPRVAETARPPPPARTARRR